MAKPGICSIIVCVCISLSFVRLWAGQDPLNAPNETKTFSSDVDRKGLLEKARAHSREKNHAAAIKTLELAFSMNSTDAEIKTLIAQEYLATKSDTKNQKEALTNLKEAIRLNPKYEPAYLEAAKIYRQRNNYYELRTIYTDLIERIGTKPNYLSELCEISALDKQYALAVEYCQKGISKDPTDPRNLVYLGQTYLNTEKVELGLKTLQKGANTFPKSDLAQIKLAEYYLSKKNFILAAKYYKQATLANPKSDVAWLGLGQSELEIQNFQLSYDAYKALCGTKRDIKKEIRKALINLHIYKQAEWEIKFLQLESECVQIYFDSNPEPIKSN